jgi:hypothetical protein
LEAPSGPYAAERMSSRLPSPYVELLGGLPTLLGQSHALGKERTAMKLYTSISVCLLALIALGHLIRVLAGWEIVIHGAVIPMWPSVLVVFVFGGLAIMLWREAKRDAIEDILEVVERLQDGRA